MEIESPKYFVKILFCDISFFCLKGQCHEIENGYSGFHLTGEKISGLLELA